MKKYKNGFTLAEVLITLVIIGIIAAMTIPTLMNKTNEQETSVAVKKAYSTLSQAYQRMIAENGEIYPENLGATVEESSKTFGDMFVKYLNVQKVCGQSTDGDCWSTQNGGMYKYFNGTDCYKFNSPSHGHYNIRLNDGMSLALRTDIAYASYGTDEYLANLLGDVNIDVNGDKGPNTLGKDVFTFWISKNGILPNGTAYETTLGRTLEECKVYGYGCTAWVVTKGNMDYLRKDVSW